MADGYFFNGRLWLTPSVMSVVDDSAMAPANLTVGNILCIIGESAGGQPNTPLRFGDPTVARNTLQSGPLCDAVVRAFAPSPETNAPSTVMAVRVGQATPATLTLNDGSAVASIVLTTNQYGLNSNLTSVKVAAGSVSGKLVTITNGNIFYTQDNIARNAFIVQYGGAQVTATMSVSNSTVTLSAPAGTPVATIALSSYSTVAQLVAAINAVVSFTATIADGQAGATPALNGLDNATAVDVKTAPYTATANLQAVVDWINSPVEGFLTATRSAGIGGVLANIPTTFMAGGTSPAAITGDWTAALSLLQTQDVQWIVPLTGDAAIHAATDAHCLFMSGAGRKERRACVGPAAGTSAAAVALLPLAINSDRTLMAFPGYYAFNAAGQRTLYPSYMTAALIGAMFSGSNPGTPMTNKALAVNGLELALADPVDTDALIDAGVCCCMQEPSGFMVVRSISTWQVNDNFNRTEMSCGAALDFVMRNVRNALAPLKGARGDPLILGQAVSKTETALDQLAVPVPQGPGAIVGDVNSPPWRNIVARLQGDVVAVSFQCSPVIPINFIPVTVFAQPFSGTATSTFSGTPSPAI